MRAKQSKLAETKRLLRGFAPGNDLLRPPSGDPTPSTEDVLITRDLQAAEQLLGVELLDRVVIGSGGRYVSLNEEGLTYF